MVNVDEAIIAKYEYCGEHFEILVDPDLAAEFRNPDGQDVAIEDLLAVEEIFKDSKKGDKASEEAMLKILSDDKLQDMMSKKSRKIICEKFQYSNMVDGFNRAISYVKK